MKGDGEYYKCDKTNTVTVDKQDKLKVHCIVHNDNGMIDSNVDIGKHALLHVKLYIVKAEISRRR